MLSLIVQGALAVSVPIRGLFNLTQEYQLEGVLLDLVNVSVPIRGLFNLTIGSILNSIA